MNTQNNSAVAGIVRHLITAVGGGLAANGTLTADDLQALVGAVMTIFGIVWSVYQKRNVEGRGSRVEGPGTGAAAGAAPGGDNGDTRERVPTGKVVGLVGLIGLILGAGCVTRSTTTGPGGVVTTNSQVAAATVVTVEIAAKHAVIFAVQKSANAEAYFEAADAVIGVLVKDQNYGADALTRALAGVKVDELHDPQVAAAIEDLVSIYAAIEGDAVAAKLDRTVVLKPVLLAIQRGFKAGLAYYR